MNPQLIITLIIVIVFIVGLIVISRFFTNMFGYNSIPSAEKFSISRRKPYIDFLISRGLLPAGARNFLSGVRTFTPTTTTPTPTPIPIPNQPTPTPTPTPIPNQPTPTPTPTPIPNQPTPTPTPSQPIQPIQPIQPTQPTQPIPVNDTIGQQPNTGASLTELEQMWVDEHNRVRNDVGQPPVKWNPILAKGAEDYAKKCVFQHSKHNDRKLGDVILGENLAEGGPYNMYTEKKLFRLWEDEKAFYRYPQGPSQSNLGETGHYTQIINSRVKEVGCGCYNCNNKKYCVCRYNPIQYGGQPPY